MNEQPRERLGSRLGFILLSVGCAVGMGNVWKFPTITGENGGAFFLIFYFIFLAILGVPLMTVEFALGRAAQKSPARLYHALTPKGSPFRAHGYLAFAGNIVLMMFYVPVCAWTVVYFYYALTGKFYTLPANDPKAFENLFGGMTENSWMLTLVVLGVVALGFFICSRSLQGGLERITKVMMIALFAIMIGLAINSFTLKGAGEGLKFFLLPSWGRFVKQGPLNVITAAMSQAFFTLSIGIGSMAIFGSFIGKDRALLGESIRVTALDTLVAVLAGLIIFPAFFTFNKGEQMPGGPGLVFEVLPQIFQNMWGGRVFGTLFFLFMVFAAFSTVLAVFQNILSCAQDIFGWKKWKACLICGVAVFLLTLPCVFGGLSFPGGFKVGEIGSVLDFEDFLVSNLLLPIGALTFTVFCTWKFGWGAKNFLAEANTGKGLKVQHWMVFYMKYILPVIIAVLLVVGVVTKLLPAEEAAAAGDAIEGAAGALPPA